MAKSPAWKNVDKLINDQKLEEASKAVEAIRKSARERGDDAEITRAIVSEVQLREALHGTETAVRFLRDEPWPKDPTSHLTLELLYAWSLMQYESMYSWEIGKREKVESKGPVDLKSWTRDQITGEAERAYQEVWASRAELGKQSIKELSEYVNPNDYPAQIRGTLRDLSTYFAVELLGDSSHWTAAESNDLYLLDLKALLGDGSAIFHDVKLDDASVHPLLRAIAALDDLERWHEGLGEHEAALEARLERLRRLHEHFSKDADRAVIRKDLEQRVAGYRQLSWYAMGIAQLADFVRETGDLVRAHDVAKGGYEAFPKSPGGVRCLATEKQIESPDVQVSGMENDGANKRSILVTHKNLSTIYFRAYRIDPFERFAEADDYNLLPNSNDYRKYLKSLSPVASWKSELPATPDYQLHKTYVTPPLAAKGFYVILASVREDFREKSNRILGLNFILSDLVLVSRNDGSGSSQVTAVSADSGKPIVGVELMLYRYDWQKRHSVSESVKSDAAGQHVFSYQGHGGTYFLVGRHGADLAVSGDSLYFSQPNDEQPVESALVYTDRSIYRPLQTIDWKVVSYGGMARTGDFHVVANSSMTVSLRDANGDVVEEKQVKTNSFGSAAGTFNIPAGRLLGNWNVVTSDGGGAGVKVEEYKRPTFEVTMKDPPGDLRLNKEATIVGEAKYYFGLPVTNGTVRFRVTREPVYPWWWSYWFYGAPRQGAQTVATGNAKVDKDGTFKMVFTPAADEREAKSEDGSSGVTYRYLVSADFTDEGGETRSAERGFRLGFVSVEAQLSLSDNWLAADKAAEMTVTRTDLNGAGKAGKGSWKLFALAQPGSTPLPSEVPLHSAAADNKKFATAGDALRSRWDQSASFETILHSWKDGAEKANGQIDHDAQGVGHIALPALAAGAYRVRYETVDPFGARYQTFQDVVVAAPGKATPLAVPAVLLAKSSSVKVGDTARFLVGSGLSDQPLFFEIYKDGKMQERRRLDGKSPVVEVAIKPSDRGGFGVVLWGVRDHQFMQASQGVMVPWDDKELKLEFSTFRDTMRPGAKETFRITVKGDSGKAEAGSAEVLAYMYDRSLDYFAPHNPPSVLALYPDRGTLNWERASLAGNSAQWVLGDSLSDVPGFTTFHGDSLKFISGYGIGGMGYGSGGGGRGHRSRLMMAPGAPATAAMAPAPLAEPMLARAMKKSDVAGKEEAEDKSPAPNKPEAHEQKVIQAPAQTQVRSNFSETAFFSPQLITDANGQAAIEFTVPDSVTSWNVWVHAITRDLRGGSLKKETRSVKELMVRPYLPRFFREGDQVDLKVVVNNASDHPLSGALTFELFDPDTKENLLPAFGVKEAQKSFTVEKGGGANLTFPVTAPRRVGPVAVRVIAKAGDFSDGELRPLPVLPGRMHLAQSRFVTLKDKDKRTMTFEDLKKDDDPTLVNEQMVVTVDAQLFYTVLKALPYLVEYPYECTEQTMNRFVSTGIVSSVYRDYPAVAKMADKMAARTTRLETWDATDPNRKMSLEETPWLQESRGGADTGLPLLNVLDPKIAKAQRDDSLDKLQKTQTSSGGFPWFSGGPPSPYITLYLMYGFAKAAEFQVAVPQDMVQRGWQYLARHFREDYVERLKKKDWGWEFLTFLNYAASAYPDASWTQGGLTVAERKEILDYCFSHWKEHSPYLKGLLALTLKRAGRDKDAKLVFDSVMDSSKTVQDQGTFWAQEDRSWLWYNDTTETHAFALRTLMELAPGDTRSDGLVLWLLLDKKVNHWKSTRATAEVIYSLVKYMKGNGTLGAKEEIKVDAPPVHQTFTFDPDQYVGKTQIVIPGERIDARTSSTITVEKETRGFAFASATWHFSTDRLPAEDRGDFFSVSRRYFKRDSSGKEVKLVPLLEGAQLAPGDEVEVQVSLRSKHQVDYVHLRDPRPAGFEPATTVSQYKWDLGIGWYEEVRDSGENFFFEVLPVGEYTFKYRLRASLGGTFKVSPATVQAMYAPEFVAYSAGNIVKINQAPSDAGGAPASAPVK